MLCCGKKAAEKVVAGSSPSHDEQAKAPPAAAPAKPANPNLVLGKYEVAPGKAGILGEGSFSVVQKGTDVSTKKSVAVKTYKLESISSDKEEMENCIKKFKRQIQVLKMLMEPVQKGSCSDSRLDHPLLYTIDPKKCFLELIDYSKEKNGEPGPDVSDGKMYVVTEVADYSLKDYLAARAEEKRDMSAETVRQITKSFIVAMAMLHVKGLVHLDMKPENIMRAGATWKVIDVDGCTPINKKISINDSSISFSPCYCAPEWANFLIEDGDMLKVGHQLDVWSVGISICELIVLDAVLKPKYVSIYRHAGSHRKAGFLFLEWLANPTQGLSLDSRITKYDSQFVDMCLKRMLTKKPSDRISLAECLKHEYIANCSVPGLDSDIVSGDAEHLGGKDANALRAKRRERAQDTDTDKKPLLKGVLFKLNTDGEKMVSEHWLRRDMWLAQNGNLCYYSQKKEKRLVLLDAKALAAAKVTQVPSGECALPNVFCIAVQAEEGATDEQKALSEGAAETETQYYAAESPEELANWIKHLQGVIEQQYNKLDTNMQMSAGLLQDFRDFKILIRNRREKIDRTEQTQYQPVFEKELWKLNTEGDPMKEEDWTFRNMWLAKNGAFCYFSKKENKELMYYRPEDIRHVRYRRLNASESCKPFSFELTLKPADGVEYAPGVFAAEDEEVMQIILGCVEKYQKIKSGKNIR